MKEGFLPRWRHLPAGKWVRWRVTTNSLMIWNSEWRDSLLGTCLFLITGTGIVIIGSSLYLASERTTWRDELIKQYPFVISCRLKMSQEPGGGGGHGPSWKFQKIYPLRRCLEPLQSAAMFTMTKCKLSDRQEETNFSHHTISWTCWTRSGLTVGQVFPSDPRCDFWCRNLLQLD